MLIIVNAISSHTGGIVTYTSNLIEFLGATDVEAVIYVPADFAVRGVVNPNIKLKPARARFFGPIHRFLWEQITWRSIVKKSHADIVYSSANYGILFPPIKQVLLVQGEINLNPIYRELVLPHLGIREKISAFLRRHLMLFSARHSESAIFPSEVARNSALYYGPDLAEKSIVNYLGVNPQFSKTYELRPWRANKMLRLIYVSVYYPHKDPLTLAEAAKLLSEEGIKTTARITMEVDDFHVWDKSKSELQKLQSARYRDVLEIGRISHSSLGDALKEYDVFVFPSMAETFGFPMVEAMCAGIPLVVSDIPVHREICGEGALYFELGNPDDLMARIIELDEDEALRHRLAAFGLERVQRIFTWENHVGNLIKLMLPLAEPKPLKLLINGLHARTGGGVTYLRNMLPLMAAEPNVEVHLCIYDDQRDVIPVNLAEVTYHFLPYKRAFWSVLMREQVEIPMLAWRLGVDTTFSPANYGPFLAPGRVILVRNAVSVGFVEQRPLKLAYWAVLYLATLLSLLTCRRAIAVSEYACFLGGGTVATRLRKRIRVVPHGVDKIYSQREIVDAREEFLLSVSDIYVQKNFTKLIQALTKLKENFPDIKLKIAGEPVDQEYYETLKRLIDIEGLAEQIEFLGYVPPKALCELYRACAVFVFPSTVETFGNPLVEAMACGAPIASSKSTAMPEVLGDAGLYFDPQDVDEIAATIKSMLLDKELCRVLSRKARMRSKQFAWELTIKQTMTALRGQEYRTLF